MTPASNWHEITASQFAWEREALDYVRGRLPKHAPYQAWSNFEFLDNNGRLYDVDLMLCGPKGVFVVEIKSWAGKVSGDDHTLIWTDPEGRVKQRDHPLRLTNLKAEALKSLVEHTSAARSFRGRVPFFEAAVFLADPQACLELTERGRLGTYARTGDGSARHPGVRDLVSALIDVSPDDHARLKRQGPDRRFDRPTSDMLEQAMRQAGVRPSNRLRTVGGFRLGELICEGPGFQDFSGQHETVSSRHRRIRLYAAPQQADDPRRVQLRRAARREHELLEGLRHQGILRPQDYVEHDLGPALVLDAEPDWPTLDQWLAEHGPRLSLRDRLDVIRQIADAVRYAHSHHLVHRALSPRAILVVPDESESQRIRIGDWRTGALTDADDPAATIAGTRNVEALADPLSASFLAPEAATDPQADGVLLDVFSLGAIAYLVVAGRPGVQRPEDFAAALRESDGLDLAAAMDGVGRDLRELVRAATAPVVTQRIDNVDLFLLLLDDAEHEASAQVESDRQPEPLIGLRSSPPLDAIVAALATLDPEAATASVDKRRLATVKFASCVADDALERMVGARDRDVAGVAAVCHEPTMLSTQ